MERHATPRLTTGQTGAVAAVAAVTAVARHPSLWSTAVRQAVRLTPRGWWRRPPFLPVPDRDYLAFRLETQYGDSEHRPEGDDVVAYLRWCRAINQ